MRMRRLLIGGVIGLAGLGAAVAESNLPFAVATAESHTVVREAVVHAVIEAVQRATVSAQTSGRVIEVKFDIDDYVTKGDVLIRFRDTEQRAALRAAEARHAEAAAEFQRIRDIFEKQLVAKSAFDRAEAAFKAARAGLEQAQEQLEHTVVRAPYSGIVVKRHIEVGEVANPGQALMTGLSLEKLRAVADVPQAHIDTLRTLSRARVLVPDGAGSVEGSKLTISPYADTVSHTFKVRVDLPPGQHGVYPGMFAKVAFAVGEEVRLLVPAAAVVHRSEVTAVYVVGADNRVALRQIRAGRTLPDGHVEVLAGLAAGERVALDPIRAGIHLKGKREGAGT
jgi:RND family efflux transporter, MFP subunit